MSVVYYISSHGLGHAVRSAAIINLIPAEIPVIVRSEVPPPTLEEEIQRHFSIEPASFDCGCVQADSFTVDGPATLAKYSAIQDSNRDRLAPEIDFLKNRKASVVVSDVASFPLRVARQASIPGLALGNFTWGDIYQPLVEPGSNNQAMLDQMREEYQQATLGIRFALSMAMSELPTTVDVPLVARQGTSIRPALAGWLDIDPDARWCLVYLGQYPIAFDWSRLTRYPGWQFLLLSKVPPPVPGIASVDPGRFDVPDVIASCQAVLGKPGYGTVADCMAADVPIVFTRPTGFAEAAALATYLANWGRAIEIDRQTCFHGDVLPSLEQVVCSKAKHSIDASGAATVAQMIVDAARGATLL
jgi:hypothetical protein